MTYRSDAVDHIRDAARSLDIAQQGLAEAVAQARREGVTWAAVGECLGITRQAAFKRFGTPIDPRTRRPMQRNDFNPEDLFGRTFELIDKGDYDTLASLMAPDVREELNADVVLGTWAEAVGEVGNLTGVTDVRTVLPGTREALSGPGDAVGTVVTEGTVLSEAGEHHGRIAVADGQIVGLLILAEAPEQPEPF